MDCTSSTPLISVIMPVYNVEPYVGEAIQSVLQQTFTDWELICVDDGSTDGSSGICAAFAHVDQRIRVVHKSNVGPGNARNVGAALARGAFIYFFDSDDIIDPRMMQTCMCAAQKHHADMVMFEARVLVEDGGIHKASFYARPKMYKGSWNGAELYVRQVADGSYFSSMCMYIMRRGLFGRAGVMAPEGFIHEDEYATYAVLARAERVVCLQRQLYVRRYRPNSIMTSYNWLASTRGYFIAYALADRSDVSDSTPAVKRARELFLKTQAKNCAEAFYRTGLPLKRFPQVIDASQENQQALQHLLCSKWLDSRWFAALRAAWNFMILAYQTKARIEKRLRH